MIGLRKCAVLLSLCAIAVLAAGCFRPASIEDQQPTVGSGQPALSGSPLPSATARQATVSPMALTATPLAATFQADESDSLTPPSGGEATELPQGVTQPALPPTPTDASPLMTPTQFPVGPEAEGCTHELQPGETLFSLARTWGTTVDEIVALNGIANPNSVAAGTELKKPGCVEGEPVQGESAPTTEAQPSDAAGGQVYVVQPGDTVFGIASRFGVTVQDIVAANPALQNNPDQISVGQELIIP